MKPTCLFLAALSLASAAFAAEVAVKIPDQGWSITFEAPALSGIEERNEGGQYAYRGGAGRFHLELFVEHPATAGRSNQDCYKFYWNGEQGNPLIVKDSIVVTETAKSVRVQYDVTTTVQEKPVRERHVNYYFVFRETWIDVHISIAAPEKGDDAVFAAFDRSLRYGADRVGKSGAF